ncbi:MAG: ABC transporter substrate-binding protein, partial [Myxococcota bacterium]|nr:ABC transporter substrate-binding protein [Myxococcota bacterium]
MGLRLLPKTFDPPELGEEGSVKIGTQVYESLLGYHPFARPYQLMPVLAESMPEVSEDRLTYTFRMKQGVTFVDDPCFPDGQGREVTAEDLLYVLKRFSHPDILGTGWWLLDGKVEGLNDWRDQLRRDITEARERGEDVGELWGIERPVEGLEVVDRYTFRFHLTQPYPQFLWILSMPYTALYPHEAVEYYGKEWRNHPVGTGPFRLVEYNPVYRAVLEANPEYREVRVPDPRNEPGQRWEGWEEDEAKGLLVNAGERIPLLDGIEIRFLLEDQPRWLYFKAGYLDFLNPPKDNTAEVIIGDGLSPLMQERGVTMTPFNELGTVYSCLNTEDELLSNVELRRAMALAFDHKWTVEHLYSGQAVVATSLIPPGVAGYDPDYHPYHSEDGTSQVDRARAAMVRAGYPEGIDPDTGRAIRVRFDNSGAGVTARHFAQRFVDDMRKIG